MVVVLTGYNRNSKFDLVANAPGLLLSSAAFFPGNRPRSAISSAKGEVLRRGGQRRTVGQFGAFPDPVNPDPIIVTGYDI